MAREQDDHLTMSDLGPESPGQQPDPVLPPGRVGPFYQWLAGLFAVGIVVLVLYALNARAPGETAGPSAPARTAGAAAPGR